MTLILSLVDGKDNMIRIAERTKSLGADTRKSLPDYLTDEDDVDARVLRRLRQGRPTACTWKQFAAIRRRREVLIYEQLHHRRDVSEP